MGVSVRAGPGGAGGQRRLLRWSFTMEEGGEGSLPGQVEDVTRWGRTTPSTRYCILRHRVTRC